MRVRDVIPALTILCLALVATALTAWNSYRDLSVQGRARFQIETEALRDAIDDTMRTYAMVLRASRAFVEGTTPLTREKWSAFVSTLELQHQFPGIQGLGFAIALQPDAVAAHEEEQRQRGRSTYSVHPPGPRPEMTSIVYLEPETWRNARAIGFDMYSEQVRRTAMQRARTTHLPSLSGKVTLVQETEESVQHGTLMYVPAFGDAPSGSGDEKRPLLGYVYAAFRMGDLFDHALASRAPEITSRLAFAIYDGSAVSEDGILHRSAQAGGTGSANTTGGGRYTTTLPIEIGGRIWTLAIASEPRLDTVSGSLTPRSIALIGTLISLLIAGIAGTLALAYAQSQAAERQLFTEIAARKLAQEEAEIANRELIHRAKNTIAVISAIASQTARHSSSIEGFTRDFGDRLNALGRVNDLLRPKQTSATDLMVLTEQVLKPYASARTNGLSISGPALALPQNEALVLSLIINELATNATKYGAWSAPNGRVAVSWELDTSVKPPTLAFTWAEAGGPSVETPTRRGFGSNVLAFVIERSLGGKLTTSYDPAGIQVQFRVPWLHGISGGC